MKILIVDDETDIRETLSEILTDDGYTTAVAGTIDQAKTLLTNSVDCAIIDIKIGNENGLDFLEHIKRTVPQIPVIMITGHGSVTLATEAFKKGAHDFLEKPLRLIQVRTCIRNALEGLQLKRELSEQKNSSNIVPIYASPLMKELFTYATKLSSVREPVVIMGPSGAGKELLARALHFSGPRAHHPFIATNAASLPVSLAESELFGHEKGAFTGADKLRIGSIEQAHGGTLFLDEIGDMDIQVQAKLLRVLENGMVVRLGSNKPIKVDVRIVCATHKDLQALSTTGAFRHDFWYRISAFVLEIPGLDKRKEDIPLLAEFFLKSMTLDLGVKREFDQTAIRALQERDYPGNVRELKNCVARLAVFSDYPVITDQTVEHCLFKTTLSPDNNSNELKTGLFSSDNYILEADYKTARNTFEKHFFTNALEKTGGNITAAANKIGMAQSNFSRKIKELGIRKN